MGRDVRIRMHRLRLPRFIFLVLLVACASANRDWVPDSALRVLVYNIHAGRDAAGSGNLERVAALITATRADLVLLQEVDRGTTRSGGVDQLAELRRLTGFHGVFGKSLDYQGGEYGIAILSRWPIVDEEVVPLRVDPPQVRAGGSVEPRVALMVETNRIRVINTHLDASREERYRLQEIATLSHLVEKTDQLLLLLGGDLNATPDSAVHETSRGAGLRDAWTECGSGAGLTYPAAAPVKRIDYLLLGDEVRCTTATVLESDASDHRPLLVTVKLSAGSARRRTPGRGAFLVPEETRSRRGTQNAIPD